MLSLSLSHTYTHTDFFLVPPSGLGALCPCRADTSRHPGSAGWACWRLSPCKNLFPQSCQRAHRQTPCKERNMLWKLRAHTHTRLHFRQTASQHGQMWPAGGVPALLHQQEALFSSFFTSYAPLTQVKVDWSVNQRNILLRCKSGVIMHAICFPRFNLF